MAKAKNTENTEDSKAVKAVTKDETLKQTTKTKEPTKTSKTTTEVAEDLVETPEKFTKSGKKSKKALEEAKAEEERQARKQENVEQKSEKKSGPKPITRSRLERRGKNYRKAAEKVNKEKVYTLNEAVQLAIDTNSTKFDATLEAHFKLDVDPRQADQNIRATVSLPHGSGKVVRVAVFAPSDLAKKASVAGADIAADEEFLAQLDKEALNFDVLISTPGYMPKLSKYARLLGPKGLMPNPKAGTVTSDIEKAVQEAKAGKIEYRVDKQGIIHVGFGKVSFGKEKLSENLNTLIESLKSQKPASVKSHFVKSAFITTTMGPSIKIDNNLA